MTHTPQKWKKKPVVIEAMQYDGTPESFSAIMEWSRPIIGKDAIGSSGLNIRISTLEGTMTASEGDWIIRGVKDEFYPCKPDIFDRTYEPATTLDPTAELASLRAEVERLRGALERIRAEHTSDGHCNLLCPVCRAAGDRWPCTTWLEAQAALLPPPKEPPDAQVRPR